MKNKLFIFNFVEDILFFRSCRETNYFFKKIQDLPFEYKMVITGMLYLLTFSTLQNGLVILMNDCLGNIRLISYMYWNVKKSFFVMLKKDIKTMLYNLITRPKLECASNVWDPYLVGQQKQK